MGMMIPTETSRTFPSTRACCLYPGRSSIAWWGCGHERVSLWFAAIGCGESDAGLSGRHAKCGGGESGRDTHQEPRPGQLVRVGGGELGQRTDVDVHEGGLFSYLGLADGLCGEVDLEEHAGARDAAGEEDGGYAADNEARA